MYPPHLEALEQRFSQERLQHYRRAVGGDLVRAIELYEWNAQISAVFWVTLGHVEVLVRNAMHEHLTVWSQTNYRDHRSYLDYGGIFTNRTLSDIGKARERAQLDPMLGSVCAGGADQPGVWPVCGRRLDANQAHEGR